MNFWDFCDIQPINLIGVISKSVVSWRKSISPGFTFTFYVCQSEAMDFLILQGFGIFMTSFG